MTQDQLYYPGRPLIDAYGNGGFRFADMSHQGSILILPKGVYQWPVTQASALSPKDFELVYSQINGINFLLLGLGESFTAPPQFIRDKCRDAGVSIETMSTGAAIRTYNVLIVEQRPVAAALIAVQSGTQ